MTDNKVDKLPGGIGDKMTPGSVDPKELEKGQKIEMEHTKDPEVAKEIALDHLTEFKDYYKRLEKMEDDAEKDKEKAEAEKDKKKKKNKGADLPLKRDINWKLMLEGGNVESVEDLLNKHANCGKDHDDEKEEEE